MEFGFNFGRPKGGGGVELWAVYLIWLGVVVSLYPVCKWFGRYKAQHQEKNGFAFYKLLFSGVKDAAMNGSRVTESRYAGILVSEIWVAGS